MSKPVTATSLSETHLSVSDLGRSVAFYRDVVGLPLALELSDRGAACFWIDAPGQAMLGLWSLDEPARPERGIVTWSDWTDGPE
jgi:hypothetical protein